MDIKPRFALIATTLLLCVTLAPAVLAVNEPTVLANTETNDTVMDSHENNGTDEEELLPKNGGFDNEDQLIFGFEASHSAPSGTEYSSVPEGFDYTGASI